MRTGENETERNKPKSKNQKTLPSYICSKVVRRDQLLRHLVVQGRLRASPHLSRFVLCTGEEPGCEGGPLEIGEVQLLAPGLHIQVIVLSRCRDLIGTTTSATAVVAKRLQSDVFQSFFALHVSEDAIDIDSLHRTQESLHEIIAREARG